jgi:hypothetical protein
VTWGGLNPALTSWRNGINQRFPGRGFASDGGYADKAHGSTSQHQPDPDGTVDAFDMDVNLLGSDEPTGTPTERRLVEALKLDFETDDRAHLWIHQRRIANEAIDHWRRRHYEGPSPHDEHTHWQSDPNFEHHGEPWRFTHTDALLRELNGDDDMQLSDEFELSPDACKALGKPAKTKVTVEGALELLLIHSARESREHYTTTSGRLDAIEGKLNRLQG